jgi:hypothetical protein
MPLPTSPILSVIPFLTQVSFFWNCKKSCIFAKDVRSASNQDYTYHARQVTNPFKSIVLIFLLLRNGHKRIFRLY